jgi:hypothetical protein
MPILQMTEQQAQRSIDAKGINHIWIESKTTGETLGIVCYELDKDTRGKLGTVLYNHFGVNVDICGAVSPPDKVDNTWQMYFAKLD